MKYTKSEGDCKVSGLCLSSIAVIKALSERGASPAIIQIQTNIVMKATVSERVKEMQSQQICKAGDGESRH